MHSLDTLFVGREFYDLPAVNSTNAHAFYTLSKSKPSEGTVISTRDQFAGRGQIGSSWESEPGKNIAASIIFYPVFLAVRYHFQLNQAVALAVADLMEQYFPEKTAIKWPNDIYLGDKKIAGILIQNTIAGSAFKHSVVGIGINVNQASFSPGIPNPTSFYLETGMSHAPLDLLAQLCKTIEKRYLTLKSGNLVPLRKEYETRLYRFQVPAFFERKNGTVFQGTITSVTESGKLVVNVSEKEELFDLKEIRFL